MDIILPLAENLTLGHLLFLMLVAFVAGFIDAIAGGGGLITIPALLTAGIPPHLSLGTNKLSSSFGSLTSAVTFFRRGLFTPALWKAASIGTLIGATTGTVIANYLDADFIAKALPAIIIATAIYTLVSKPATPDENADRKSGLFQWVHGLILGGYDGVAGPGTGAFWTASALHFYRMEMLKTLALARTMNFISNITSLVTFALLGHVAWGLGIAMGSTLMLGAWCGSHSAIRMGNLWVRRIFILLVILISLRLAWQHWIL
ncbi:TSUP family transporter [Oceanospirillum linum]|nr:TSUP family transporter [Oceanospirillum linum]SEG51126.1 hypothetical protein SAMN04489856_11434 [Oleiphilus messinensis]SMP35108.1 hypothetical protein SAMN06264348_1123 [Oceanospirillum linum]